MDINDSDSDDFFSDIRALRRKFGLASKQQTPSKPSTHSTQQDEPALIARKRPLTQQPASPSPAPSASTVTPGEIAALLSPRKQRRSRRVSIELSPSSHQKIPPRTAESRRITSPLMSPTLRSLWDNRYTQTPPARSPRVQSPLQLDNALVIPAYGSPQQTGLLGSVEDALVTKSALERAARKLAESEALTQQQIICELCERLKSYHSPDDQPETPDLWQGATLLGQFYTLGHGSLAHSSRGLLWSGRMLANVASAMQARLNLTVAGAAEAEEQANLLFPWAKLTAVRRKSIDDDELIMVTVDEDMGVAFLLADMSTAAIDSRVADINAQLAAHLAHERSTPRNTVPHEPQGTAVGSSSADPCENLVRGLLELAAETQQSRLRSADIDRALKSDTFRESAAALTAALSLRLAEMAELAAQTAPVEPVDDDPGTETIPGTCTLCYSATESIELAPCCHRVCTECFARLQTMQKTSPTCAASTTSTNVSQLACPWDRSPVTKWTALG